MPFAQAIQPYSLVMAGSDGRDDTKADVSVTGWDERWCDLNMLVQIGDENLIDMTWSTSRLPSCRTWLCKLGKEKQSKNE